VLWQNYRKVRALERRLADQVDLLTAITDEDARALKSQSNATRAITLTPGYDGYKCTERTISANTPRRVVIVGSFRWVVKRENLLRFIEAADSTFADNGIDLQIMGEVPDDLRTALSARCRATKFLGFQPNLAKVFDHARIAVVPELIGGGFKLKFLDYLFGRVPVAAVHAATSGLPSAVRENMLLAKDYASLTNSIVGHINQFDELNRMQSHAFAAADRHFDWDDRGTQLLHAICAARPDQARVNAPVRVGAPADQVSS
jgi:glycosyltransferase involved in cell wall biosynthesis